MTADELMRLVNRYVEACDDLGDGLFEKPLTTTDDLHAKATGLHKQILDEVYRLHADVAQARQTAEYWKAEHLAGSTRIGELHDELAETASRAADYLRRAIKAEAEIARRDADAERERHAHTDWVDDDVRVRHPRA